MLKNVFTTLVVSIFFLLSGTSQVLAEGMDNELYQKFLDQFVRKDQMIRGIKLNVVNYKAIYTEKNNTGSLYQQVLDMVKNVNLESLTTREEKIAFWINVYNISAIKMIIDHYPVDSIRSRKISWIKNPWGKEIITVGGKNYSLSEIEHEILLTKLKEPMAHFGIVCASVSCPDLSNHAYKADSVKEQLSSMAQSFLRNRNKGLKIDRKKGKVYFSQIFKFDTKTFPDGAKDALSFIIPNVQKEDAEYLAAGKYKIEYFDYDWFANGLTGSRRVSENESRSENVLK